MNNGYLRIPETPSITPTLNVGTENTNFSLCRSGSNEKHHLNFSKIGKDRNEMSRVLYIHQIVRDNSLSSYFQAMHGDTSTLGE